MMIFALVVAGVVLELVARDRGFASTQETGAAKAATRGPTFTPKPANPPYYKVARTGPLRVGEIRDNKPLDPADLPRQGTDPFDETEPGDEAEPGAKKTWKQWEKYEATFTLSWSFANPYDPDEVMVDAVITTPSGKVESAPAFWYVPCTSRFVDRVEEVNDPDEDTLEIEAIDKDTANATWMLRYTPREQGEYTYRLVARTPAASAYSYRETFHVSGVEGRGFGRVSRGGRYFEFDDGSFFFPIGQNVAWPNDRGWVDFAAYMATMNEYGANWARVWLSSYFRGLTIEWSPKNEYYHGLGFYSAEIAWKLDRILESAEKHNIYLMWCIQQHGQFSTRFNPCWDENPYNNRNGGPLERPADFFTHPEARKLFRHRMRYYVARYGYSPTLFAWEFWNEVDLTDRFSSAACAAWHKEMADYVRGLDPTRRLLSTSYIYGWDTEAYALPAIDFTQVHIYHGAPSEFIGWRVKSVDEQMRNIKWDGTLRKPVLIGEYGLGHSQDYFREGPNSRWPVDPDGLHVHNSLWVGLFSGSAGTAMNWWWDKYIRKNKLYGHFIGISRYLDGEDLRPWGLGSVKLFDDFYRTPEVLTYVLVGRDRAYGWVFETAYTLEHFGPGDSPREGVPITLTDLTDGDCWIEFWDTYDGVPVARTRGHVSDGTVRFTVPAFRGDIAFKLYRGEPAAEIQETTPIHDRMVRNLRELAKRHGRDAKPPPPPPPPEQEFEEEPWEE